MRAWAVIETGKPLQEIELPTPEPTGKQVLLAPPLPSDKARPFVDETSLNTRAAREALGVALPMLREGMNRLAEQAENGYRERIQSGTRQQRQRQRAA